MDYEQKCKEYLERAKEQLNGAKVFDYDNEQIAHAIRTTVYSIFPGLKESEDERIRKTLINFFDGWGDKIWDSGIKYSEVVAWIQKQGEQKPTWSEEDKGVLLESISVLQSSSHWVLADKLKSLKDRGGCEVNCTTTKEWSEKDEKGLGGALWCCKQAASIAKDENDMDNCWYAENWLKSLKPRSHCVVTKDELNMAKKDAYNNALDKIEYSSGEPTFDDGWNAALSFVRKRVAGIEGDEDIIIREKEPDDAYLKGVCDTKYKLEKQGEKNPAWSEEDEYTLGETIQHLEELIRIEKVKHCGIDVQYYQRDIAWLKSLKDRVQPQIKQKWSEDDKKKYIGELQSLMFEWSNRKENMGICIDRHIDKLLSLHPQSHWKPSDEHYELEEFAKIVRGNLTGISKAVQELFKAKYLQLTGNKMYGGYKD